MIKNTHLLDIIKNIKWERDKHDKLSIEKTFQKNSDHKEKEFKKKAGSNLTISNPKFEYTKDIITIKQNDKDVFTFKYKIIGLFNTSNSVWYWSWALPFVNKTLVIKEPQETFNKFIDVNYKTLNPHEADEYYFYTKNNNFFIQEEDIHKLINMIVSMTNSESYIKIKTDEKIEYFLITDIIKVK